MWTVTYREYEDGEDILVGVFSSWEKAAKVSSALNIRDAKITAAEIDPYIDLIENDYYPFLIEISQDNSAEYAILPRYVYNMKKEIRSETYSPKKGVTLLRVNGLARTTEEAAKIAEDERKRLKWGKP